MHAAAGEMKTTSEENKENPSVKNSQPINDLLMKPFSLGWTREVVRRAVTHSGTPSCDIYYFNPNKKKLRSLIEVKSNLTDGLSLDCFSFKREPLGLSSDLEIVRDAKVRGKGNEKSKVKRNISDGLRKPVKAENTKQELKKKKAETEEEDSKPETKKRKMEIEEEDPKPDTVTEETCLPKSENSTGSTGTVDAKESESNDSETKPRRTKSDLKESNENKSFNCNSKTRTKAKSTAPVRLQPLKNRKSALKRVGSAKQAKVVPGRKLLKKIVSKKVASPKRKLSKAQTDKNSGLKSKKNSSSKTKRGKKQGRNSLTAKAKNDVAKVPETNENEKKSIARDLKSIVKKNIGKYREMREKQKLGTVKNQKRNPSKKLATGSVSRSRSEPISKNRPFYLKPLEKGWRRELVYRTNCAKAGQQADVYYFHPNGKKLRSCREIAENLTHGLSIECFTFRKEPIGCGEPSEVIRNAKSFQKN